MKTTTEELRKSRNSTSFSEFAIKLKAFRKWKKFTQVELAKELNITQPMVYKYENGLTIIPMEIPKYLHQHHNMSYDWFYDNIGPMERGSVSKSLVTDIIHLTNEIDQLKAEHKALNKNFKKLFSDFYAQKRDNTGALKI